ncbi:MAG: hypothetical protein ACKO0V_15315, partial [bacterium]
MISRMKRFFGEKQPARYRLLRYSTLQKMFLAGLSSTLPGSFVLANNHGLFGNHPVTITTPTSYQVVVPTTYTVLSPVVSHSYLLAPTVQVLPASWLTTTAYLPGPCSGQNTVSPALEPTRVPELQEIPAGDKAKSAEPKDKPPVVSNPKEPNF